MSRLSRIGQGVSRWIDSVATAVIALIGSLTASRPVALREEENGTFVLEADGREARLRIADGHVAGTPPRSVVDALRGARVELALQPGRFMFRPLELPKRAAEFIDGVVRQQIDRLTPWSAEAAAFGWSKPADAGADRIAVTVAATAKTMIMPFVQALAGLGAGAIAVSTAQNGETIRVLEENAHNRLDAVRVRRALITVLAVAVLAAAGSIGAAVVIGGDLDQRQDLLTRRIAERRAALRAGNIVLDSGTAAQRLLERRKHESPLSVIVLDVLSRVLPDHTYVTELRIEGDKLRVSGLTRDAPGLISLIEQSGRFSRATFFAPTTRAPSDSGERFHIEARIEALQPFPMKLNRIWPGTRPEMAVDSWVAHVLVGEPVPTSPEHAPVPRS